jgi:hypothetical protein
MRSSEIQSAVPYPSLADNGDALAEQVNNFLRFTGADLLE